MIAATFGIIPLAVGIRHFCGSRADSAGRESAVSFNVAYEPVERIMLRAGQWDHAQSSLMHQRRIGE